MQELSWLPKQDLKNNTSDHADMEVKSSQLTGYQSETKNYRQGEFCEQGNWFSSLRNPKLVI